ncbi:hypothetical protein HY78_12310 [Rhizorhabdus wittichii DC-6]|jgi:sugar O-acyltransferase (sialic acid O-acetyltransferase NeuD family)|uniref:Serine acetyltransferase-like protein n=1 Tax=Rhizorhabdus wittichii (strain DSM 6014 / CCUG 31198 / JCM 15750 / NBRC 105917 / EY 4224 / RW1) TaxID=392499 RepID=A0A9J9HCH1_RHIWR|nr:Serine acetyltransferase-like protein [Rhizorhabdus wittichii RW1]ARR54161.1 hypothetical protein HY78_12310 [Rhizorhabdus wittichii DC-6]
MTKRLCIIGSSGFSREVMDVGAAVGYDMFCFADSGSNVDELVGFPVHDDEPETIAALAADGWHFAIGIGGPRLRKKVAEKMADCHFPALIHPGATFGVSQRERIGDIPGIFIAAGVRMTNNIDLGPHCLLNLNVTVGHDTILEPYSAAMPGVNISGNVHVGEGAYLGTGSSVIHGGNDAKLLIGAFATIGAGAVVVRDVEPGVTAVGMPAKPLVRA